jgi:outer membrane protein assembly factor BamB
VEIQIARALGYANRGSAWRLVQNALLVAPASTDGTVVVALSERHTDCFNAADGRPLWTVPGAHSATADSAQAVYLAVSTVAKNQPQGD